MTSTSSDLNEVTINVNANNSEQESLDSSLNILADAAALCSDEQQIESFSTATLTVNDSLESVVCSTSESDLHEGLPVAAIDSLLHVLDNGNFTYSFRCSGGS